MNSGLIIGLTGEKISKEFEMKTVTFKFDMDQKVRMEKLGIVGVVSMCALSDGGNTYYLLTADGSSWIEERLLTAVDDE
jgi:hypothetical protein